MTENPSKTPGHSSIVCPQCGYPLHEDDRICPHCGIDLMMVALLAERSYLEGYPEAAPIASAPQALTPRIGDYLLDHGLISQEQLDAALEHQQKMSAQGKHCLLGKILVDLGSVEPEMLDRAIGQQILSLHAALQEANRSLERRVAERTAELRQALKRLTELNRLKANLIANVSHELRTPLAQIKGYIELIGGGELGPLTPEQESGFDVLTRACNRLENLIEDLIEFSTASREGLVLKSQAVDLKTLILEAIEQSQQKADKSQISLKAILPEYLPKAYIDPDRIKWVLLQLIDNAIKFTPAEGHVTLEAISSGILSRISISDTGIGFPIDKTNELFEPFHQLDGSATRHYGGTGLGLALVKLILDTHGVELHVESEPGRGSTFSLSLPAAMEEL